jgi:hypothetical protein
VGVAVLPIGSENRTDLFKMSSFIFGEGSDSTGVDGNELAEVDIRDGEAEEDKMIFNGLAVSIGESFDLGISMTRALPNSMKKLRQIQAQTMYR